MSTIDTTGTARNWRRVPGPLILAAAVTATLVIPVLAAAPARAASIIYVRATATGAANGASWKDAYPDLQTALTAAVPGDRIWVAKGTYRPTSGTDRARSFTLKTGVELYGGFRGTEKRLAQRDPQTHLTILSGNIGDQGDDFDNAYHVVDGSFASRTALLDGFKIIGGSNFGAIDGGSGILVNGASAAPRLRNLVVSGNRGAAGGGIAVTGGATPVISDTVVAANFAGGGYGLGGGMTIRLSNPVLRNITFSDNVGSFGGGLYVDAPIIASNLTFVGNTIGVGGSGPGVYADAAITLTNSVLWDGGGELLAATGTPTITDSIVQGGCPAGVTCSRIGAGDPRLGPLRDNGGMVPSRAPGRGSAAIDAGGNAACTAADTRGLARPQGGRCDAGAVEVQALTFSSQAAYDGFVTETSRTSGRGGSVSAGAGALVVGDDVKDRQSRGILSFATALPSGATVVKASLRMRRTGVTGTPFADHGDLLVDARRGPFGGALALRASDFQAAATRSGAGTLAAGAGTSYAGDLTASALGAVRRGTTQLRLRFDVADDGDHRSDTVSFASGDGPRAKRPRLVVYVIP